MAVLLTGSACFSADITTLDGTTYKDATVIGIEASGVHIRFRQGVVKVPFYELPEDLQRQYRYALAQAPAANPAGAVTSATGQTSNFLADNAGAVLVLGGLALIALVVFLAVLANARSRAADKALNEKLTAELHAYGEAAKQANKLPTVSTNLFLKPGESAFYDCTSSLYETRAVRQFQAGHVGFRVAKGVWVGGSQGRSVSSQEWSKIDDGRLTITNTRIIFEGTKGSRNMPLNKIIDVQSFLDGVELAIENKQKNVIFTAPNPYIAEGIIRCLNKLGPGPWSESEPQETKTLPPPIRSV
jgi:hypothetical protein